MIYVHDFSEIYRKQTFYKEYNHVIYDDGNLSGVKGYLDDGTRKILSEKIALQDGKFGIHFLGSGSYHHLSRLYLDFIDRRFNLIVYDNHTDMQESAFGDILSCGSWIADAHKCLENLEKIFIIGAKKQYIEECEFKHSERVCFLDAAADLTELCDFNDGSLPVYVSVDKDVLSEKEFVSDWDQGEMSVNTLLSGLSFIKDNFSVIGVDVCGEPTDENETEIHRSDVINNEIIKIFEI